MPHLEILTKYAIKHAVAFSGVESNAIVEAMEDYALQQTAKYKKLVEAWEKSYDFILKYIDYEKMSHEDVLKIWHLDHLQKITDLKEELQ